MGADFMYAVAPQPELNDDRRAQIKKLLQEIPVEDFLEVQEMYQCFAEEGEDEEMRDELFETIVEVCELDNRETSGIQLDGMDWAGVITGGMSWGDRPTEAFDAVAIIGYFPTIFDLLADFSREDLNAS